ncbi:MAG: Mur ligase domain-containing protein [Candidatus Sungiibacteriota bacterium]
MKQHRVHFVGIGGIGVSALARWYLSEGWRVSGSDIAPSEITEELLQEGIPIAIGPHKPENIPEGIKLVIYSAAAKKNKETAAAKRKKIKTLSYAEALGELTKKNLTIAVAGSHGKSTTTALVALILIEAGFDPTVIIGTKLKEFTHPSRWQEAWLSSGRSVGSNFRKGKSPILVIEADEWNGSFWNYRPAISIVLNIDKEHLDFYKTHGRVKAAFKKFLLNGVPGSRIIINAEDQGAREVAALLLKKHPKRFGTRIHYYTLASPKAASLRPLIALPGRHNASNAMAAFTLAKILNIPEETVKSVFMHFKGAWRRFERVGTINGAPVIADYAHHPAEISSTIQAARAYSGKKKVIAVFQPHHYERTRDLFPEFTKALAAADTVCLLDIYEVAGREKKRRDSRIHSFHLARKISEGGRDSYHLPYPSQLKEFLEREADADSVILMMGAGSIWELTKSVVQ